MRWEVVYNEGDLLNEINKSKKKLNKQIWNIYLPFINFFF